jgi:2-polyprenyl-3-methyl-5-hydroxy-6-metoxy-1,4-benzoquinol methylase
MSAIATTSAKCPICGTEPSEPHAHGRDFEYGTTGQMEWAVRRCARCDVLALSPRPADSELHRIYPGNYYAYDFSNRRSIGYMVKALLDRRAAAAYLEYGRGNVLDVGCGDGRLLRAFAGLGVAPDRLFGVELDARAVEAGRAQGFQIEQKRFEDTDYRDGFFHLIVLQQVIEHVGDPRGMIEKLGRVLAPQGAVILETPNIASWDHSLFRRRYWGGYHIPRHFFLFSKRSLRRLLEQCGFEVASVRSLASPMFWIHSVHHAMAEKRYPAVLRRLFDPYPPNPIALTLFTLLDVLGKALGVTSNMRMVAVRK